MKGLLVLLVIGAINLSYGGIVPASTTLLRSSNAIAYPSPLVYSQQHAPLALSYSAPLAYAHAVAPAVYSQQFLAPSAYYARPLYTHGPVLAQQSIVQQVAAGVIAQNPVVGHYPVGQVPVIGQYPGIVQEPSQIPIQGGAIIGGGTDNPQIASPLPPAPSPPQQSPILSGGSGETAFDDDTVSVEAA